MKNYDSMFMDFAERTAKESNCLRYSVGAVAVKDNRIILQGYNGTISGFVNCCDKFKDVDFSTKENQELHHKWSSSFEIHAEMNILSYAAKAGISLQGTKLYCTHTPCNNCLKHLIQAGVQEVIYKTEYIDKSNQTEREDLLKLITIKKYEK